MLLLNRSHSLLYWQGTIEAKFDLFLARVRLGALFPFRLGPIREFDPGLLTPEEVRADRDVSLVGELMAGLAHGWETSHHSCSQNELRTPSEILMPGLL
jgi:hypothetical protein